MAKKGKILNTIFEKRQCFAMSHTMPFQVWQKMLYLPTFGAKIWWEILDQYNDMVWRGRQGEKTPLEDHTYQGVHAPLMKGDHGDMEGRWRGYHCRWRASMSCSTSSQLSGSWYLPRFLLRGGSLTPMNIASFIVLIALWDSLSTIQKLPSWMEWIYGVGMGIDGGGSS